jgi:ATP-dependent protease ClpP protease subunit
MFKDSELYGPNFYHIFIYDLIDQNLSALTSEKINEANNLPKSKLKGIIIHINSPGGCVSSSFGIINTIRSSRLPVISIVEGVCMSAATFILVVSSYRVMCRHTNFLIHQLSYGLYGTHDNITFKTEMSDNLLNMIKSLFLKYTKIDKKFLLELVDTEIILSPEDCLKHGMTDHIFQPKKKVLKIPDTLHTYKYYNIYMYFLQEDENLYRPTAQIIYELSNTNVDSLIRFKSSNRRYCKTTEIARLIPVINHIINTAQKVSAIIDGYHNETEILAFLVCDARYINVGALIYFDFVGLISHAPGRCIEDLNANTQLKQNYITYILDNYTKLPASIKNNVFKNRYIFNNTEAIKYGLCDKII